MLLIDFLKFFKDTNFEYKAQGFQGGTASLRKTNLGLLGNCYPLIALNTYTINICSDLEIGNNQKELTFSSYSKIDNDTLSLELIRIEELRIYGNNRSVDNYYNDFSKATLLVNDCKPSLKSGKKSVRLIDIIDIFKECSFQYTATGINGGTDRMITFGIENFGGSSDQLYKDAIIVMISSYTNGFKSITERRYSNIKEIDEKLLNSNFVKIVRIKLIGNNLTEDNYLMDQSSITVMISL